MSGASPLGSAVCVRGQLLGLPSSTAFRIDATDVTSRGGPRSAAVWSLAAQAYRPIVGANGGWFQRCAER